MSPPHFAKDDVVVSMHDRASVQTFFCVRVASTWAFVFSSRRECQKSVSVCSPKRFSPQRWQSLLSPVGTHEPIQGAIITEATYRFPYSPFGIRKCEHLAACSKHPSCAAQVVGSLPRDEVNQQGTPSAVPTQNRVTVTPWTQITSEMKHMQLWEKKDRRTPWQHEFFGSDVGWLLAVNLKQRLVNHNVSDARAHRRSAPQHEHRQGHLGWGGVRLCCGVVPCTAVHAIGGHVRSIVIVCRISCPT